MQRWIFRLLLGGMLAFVVGSILLHPLATNDGPVHVAFSHLILTYGQPAQPLQEQAYTLNLRPNPNLAVYLLMAALMKIFSPSLTESIIQVMCIAGPVLAGYFAIYVIDRRNVWLSIFLLPLALNQMLFLGLYNHCMSMAVFFLIIGTYFWMNKAPSFLRALALSGTLLLVFFCHASGFVMAFTGVGAISTTVFVLSAFRDRRVLPALKAQRYTIAAMLAPLPLGAVFVASGGGSITKYGIRFGPRLLRFAKLHLLAVNYPERDRFPAITISVLLFAAFCIVAARILLRRRDLPQPRRDLAIGTMVAAVLATAIMLAFPDIMGGGWTHFRRFVIFPYFWIILTLAFDDFSIRAFACLTGVGASTALILIASMASRQRTIREELRPLSDVDALIGNHCSVLPIVIEPYLVDKEHYYDLMEYTPFYQSASRLELHGDRVVLFNYLARLNPYPVHFRPGVEPQAHIFLWKPQQMENEVENLDLSGFEASSGMRVDYILLWGNLYLATPEMQTEVESAVGQFDLIYRSARDSVKLFRRRDVHNAACTLVQQVRR